MTSNPADVKVIRQAMAQQKLQERGGLLRRLLK
jgi:hypothetical protein